MPLTFVREGRNSTLHSAHKTCATNLEVVIVVAKQEPYATKPRHCCFEAVKYPPLPNTIPKTRKVRKKMEDTHISDSHVMCVAVERVQLDMRVCADSACAPSNTSANVWLLDRTCPDRIKHATSCAVASQPRMKIFCLYFVSVPCMLRVVAI